MTAAIFLILATTVIAWVLRAVILALLDPAAAPAQPTQFPTARLNCP